MNCNCIEEITEKAKQHAIDNKMFKKEVKKASLKNVSLALGGHEVKQRTYSQVEIELEGQKKKPTMDIYHAYCPYCGTEIQSQPAEAAK